MGDHHKDVRGRRRRCPEWSVVTRRGRKRKICDADDRDCKPLLSDLNPALSKQLIAPDKTRLPFIGDRDKEEEDRKPPLSDLNPALSKQLIAPDKTSYPFIGDVDKEEEDCKPDLRWLNQSMHDEPTDAGTASYHFISEGMDMDDADFKPPCLDRKSDSQGINMDDEDLKPPLSPLMLNLSVSDQPPDVRATSYLLINEAVDKDSNPPLSDLMFNTEALGDEECKPPLSNLGLNPVIRDQSTDVGVTSQPFFTQLQDEENPHSGLMLNPFSSEQETDSVKSESSKGIQVFLKSDLQETLPLHDKRMTALELPKPKEMDSCTECITGFKTENELEGHLHTIHDQAVYCSCTDSENSDADVCLPDVQQQFSEPYSTETETGIQMEICEDDMEADHSADMNAAKCSKDCAVPDLLTQSSKYTCEYCELSFHYAKDWLLHHHIHTGIKPFYCVRCGEKFNDDKFLNKHRRQHLLEDKEICSQCDRRFDTLLMLQSHSCCTDQKSHLKKKRFSHLTCQICDKHLKNPERLDAHLSSHTGVKTFRCPLCECELRHFGSVEKHIKYHVQEIEKRETIPTNGQTMLLVVDERSAHVYDCLYCQQDFKDLASYELHIETHFENSTEKTESNVQLCLCGKKYICGFCHEMFIYHVRSIYHVRVQHTCLKPNICRKCDTSFIQHYQLLKHRCLKAKSFFCKMCEQDIVGKDGYEQHVESHVELTSEQEKIKVQCRMGVIDGQYECGYCGKKYKSALSLTWHIRDHTGIQPYQCDKCKYTFKMEDKVKKHKCPPDLYECKECLEEFRTLGDLELHMEIHVEVTAEQEDIREQCLKFTQEGKHICGYCDYKSPTFVALIRHVRLHTLIKPYGCKRCNQRFMTGALLTNHDSSCKMKTRGGKKHVKRLGRGAKNTDGHNCVNCGLKIHSWALYEEHIETHVTFTSEQLRIAEICKKYEGTISGKYVCGFCDQCFKTKAPFMQHIRRHTGVKPYVCKECNQGFIRIHGLDSHDCSVIKVPRTYQCKICQKVMSSLNKYEEHLETHVKYTEEQRRILQQCMNNDGNKYLCGFCNRIWSESVSMICHYRRHTGVRPHTCNHCDLSYDTLLKLKSHQCETTANESSKDAPYVYAVCKICHEECNDTTSYENHVETHVELTPEQQSIKAQCITIVEGEGHKCGFCEAVFESSLGLTCHFRTHTAVKPHQCDHCMKCFMQYNDLLEHSCRVLSSKKKAKRKKCTYCDLVLPSTPAFEEHIETHFEISDEQEKIRKICLVTNGKNKLQCGYCNRVLSQSGFLSHVRIHMGLQPHHCDVCKKRFYDYNSLKSHKCHHMTA